MSVTRVREDEVHEPKIWYGVEEMKTWEWEYGSSPEFSNLIEGELSFGSLVKRIFPHSGGHESQVLMLMNDNSRSL